MKKMSPWSVITKSLAGNPENTQRRYATLLRQFCKHLGGEPETPRGQVLLMAAVLEDVLDFLAEMRKRPGQFGKGTADETIRNTFGALRGIYRRLLAAGLVKINPFDLAKGALSWRQRTQVRPTQIIPFDKVWELLDLPAGNTSCGIRDRALLSLMLGGGLRRSEARNVRLQDVMVSSAETLYINIPETKAGRGRQQPLAPWSAARFSALVCQRRDEGAQSNDFLFVFYYATGKVRGQISESTGYRTFRDYCAQLGIKAAPHAARATAASMLHKQGYNERQIADFLGHASLRMVPTYIKLARGVEENAGKTLEFPRAANG